MCLVRNNIRLRSGRSPGACPAYLVVDEVEVAFGDVCPRCQSKQSANGEVFSCPTAPQRIPESRSRVTTSR
ncbi:hypothetical protein D2E53_14445 [Mycobacteroides abscessus]|nr:hypothetical protein D2E53_14445 [Mycobacteroides abscessus]